MRRMIFLTLFAIALPSSVRADLIHYHYIGVDNQVTLPNGTYAGLANPNWNRLTFLFGHQDTANPSAAHYHPRGVYSYTGPNLGGSTTVNPFGTNNNAHDSGVFNLQPGSGSFAGYYRTGVDFGQAPLDPAAIPQMKSVDALAGATPGSIDYIQYHSTDSTQLSSGVTGPRWHNATSDTLAGHQLQLQLVSITAGLKVFLNSTDLNLQNPGDTYNLGDGGALDFTPIFATTIAGFTGTATFILHDLSSSGAYGDSGQFTYTVTGAAVPEPSSFVLLGTFAIGMAGWRRFRNRHRPQNGASVGGSKIAVA